MSRPIDRLNAATRDEAIDLLEPLVERSRWVAELTVDERPFADHADLANALIETVLNAGTARQLDLFGVHPELAGREASENSMTIASTSEQGRLGLLSLTNADARRLARLNTAYRERFGYPFIIALHRIADLRALFEAFERRISGSPQEEPAATLAEIASVIRSRSAQAFGPSHLRECVTASATQE
jgi:2-oxo-4-hydroxy-4-carboxy-5-ureidoimidazoline decarboxylase